MYYCTFSLTLLAQFRRTWNRQCCSAALRCRSYASPSASPFDTWNVARFLLLLCDFVGQSTRYSARSGKCGLRLYVWPITTQNVIQYRLDVHRKSVSRMPNAHTSMPTLANSKFRHNPFRLYAYKCTYDDQTASVQYVVWCIRQYSCTAYIIDTLAHIHRRTSAESHPFGCCVPIYSIYWLCYVRFHCCCRRCCYCSELGNKSIAKLV